MTPDIVVCVNCNRQMVRAYSGVEVAEFKDKDLENPYKFYSADVYICNCPERRVLHGFGAPTHAESLTAEQVEKRLEQVKIRFY